MQHLRAQKPYTTAQKLKRRAMFAQVSTSTASHLPRSEAIDAVDSAVGRSLVPLQLSEDTRITDELYKQHCKISTAQRACVRAALAPGTRWNSAPAGATAIELFLHLLLDSEIHFNLHIHEGCELQFFPTKRGFFFSEILLAAYRSTFIKRFVQGCSFLSPYY